MSKKIVTRNVSVIYRGKHDRCFEPELRCTARRLWGRKADPSFRNSMDKHNSYAGEE